MTLHNNKDMTSTSCWLIIIIMTNFSVIFSSSVTTAKRTAPVETHESLLIKYLFDDYDLEVRPVLDESAVVNVSFNMALIQIVSIVSPQAVIYLICGFPLEKECYPKTLTSKFRANISSYCGVPQEKGTSQDVDVKNQVSKTEMMTVSLWIRQEWYNPLLHWNPDDFGGIKTINVDAEKLWVPDIILYNNADGTYGGGYEKYKTKIILEHTGKNKWYSPASFTSTCKINVKLFPFDSQNCRLKFGSWTFGGDRLVMATDKNQVDMSKYVTNGEWDIINVTSQLNANKYSCCPYLFYDVTFDINVRRKSLYYIFNLILPCALISALTLMKFFLPVESGEKIGLGVTALLAMTVFLLIVAETLPSTSEHIPLLGEYFIALMANTSLALIATCFVLVCYYKNPRIHPMPKWFRKVIYGMKRIMCMKTSDREKERIFGKSSEQLLMQLNGDIRLRSYNVNRENAVVSYHQRPNGTLTRRKSADSCNFHTFDTKLLKGLRTIADHMRKVEEEAFDKNEWRNASIVLDLFCFYVFLILTLFSIFFIFLRILFLL